MKARVFSAFIKGVDEKPVPSVWGEKLPFNTVCADYGASLGWIHSIKFSPSGNGVAWVSHDSTLNISYPGENYFFCLKNSCLPFTCLLWISETSIVAAGHDSAPFLFSKVGSEWKLVEKIDQGAKKSNESSGTALNMFKQMDSRGQATSNDVVLDTCHQNSINCLVCVESKGGVVSKFSSTGVDGKLVIWDAASFSNLRIK